MFGKRAAFCAADATHALMKDLGFTRASRWYIVKRSRHEGVKFVTVVLPTLAKHILQCLEFGRWTPFKGPCPIKTTGQLRYTAFIADELKMIFEDSMNPDCALNLWRVRQLCEYFYKLALPFDRSCLDQAAEKFLTTDLSLDYDREFANQVRKSAETLFVSTKKLVFSDVAKYSRFGPGSFSGHTGYQGDNMQAKKDILDGAYPVGVKGHSGFFRRFKTSIYNYDVRYGAISFGNFGLKYIASIPYLGIARLTKSKKLPLRAYKPVVEYSEVLFVPKDSRGPRTIVREPLHNLFIQMGLHEALKTSLSADTNGRIQFISQEEFRNLAQRSSLNREFTTLDLSEASDSVSAGIACTIFQNFPAFTTCFKYYRTKRCRLPNGTLYNLRKLSGMGSGFTFPVMAAIIYAAIYTSIPKYCRQESRPLIYVYGDDIIIPTKYYENALRALSKCGLTVNANKSFRRSFFRESCGGDYYLGENVAPVRLKLNFVQFTSAGTQVFTNRDPQKFIFKLERHCRECIQNGLLLLADYYYQLIGKYIGHDLPLATDEKSTPLVRLTRREYIPMNWNTPPELTVVKPMIRLKRRLNAGINQSFYAFLQKEDEVIFGEPTILGMSAERYNVKLTTGMVYLSELLR